MFHVPEHYRITRLHMPPLRNAARLVSDRTEGNNGAFYFLGPCGRDLLCIASDERYWKAEGLPGAPWEHVSVSLSNRPPNWEEMCRVKDLFWDDSDCVVQYHPPKSDYVNFHPYVLHLWRPVGVDLPRPPHLAVGPRTQEEFDAQRKALGV